LAQEREKTRLDETEGALVLPDLESTLKEPSLYKVWLHNDDYTPMEFVVEILETIFRKANTLATKVMLDIHNKGSGLCGVYPYEIAETKVAQVIDKAKQHRHPLKCTMEEE
jgi:ATP-dependent Clp protease adaptor protein ClpS